MLFIADYNFVSREAMEAAIKNKEFIEYAEFSANLYGTRSEYVINRSYYKKIITIMEKNVIQVNVIVFVVQVLNLSFK